MNVRNEGVLLPIPGIAEIAAQVTTRYRSMPHFHDTYSVGIFSEPATIWCRGRLWAIGPRQIAVLEPREVHGGRGDARECPQDAFYPDPRLLAKMFGAEEPVRFPTPVIEDPELAAEFAAAAGSAAPDRLRAAIRELFVRHGICGRPASPIHSVGKALGSKIEAALDRSVAECSRAAGLSPSHFSRRVRALLGLSPRDYRRQQRVLAARALIESGQDLSSCALEAGFADQAHMTRQMRSMLGVTPGLLRRTRTR